MTTKHWVEISIGCAALVVFFLVSSAADMIWDYFELPLFEQFVITMPQIIGLFAAGAVYFVIRTNRGSNVFLNEVVVELSKVTWPARKESLVSAVVVLVMVGIASLILVSFDALWGKLSQMILKL